MAPGRRGRQLRYDDGGGGGSSGTVPLPQRVLIYLIFFSIPGLLLFIVPTVKIGGGGGGGGLSAVVSAATGSRGSTPWHMGGHVVTSKATTLTSMTYKNNAESELLLEDLTAGVGEIADDFMRSNELQQAAARARNAGGGGGGGGSVAAHTAGGGDDGLGELADPDEDPITPVHMESSTRPDAAAAGGGAGGASSASAGAGDTSKESMLLAARGWGAELGINSSFARSEKLYKLVRSHANLDMRLFMSLKGINRDCRYLADGDGRVPNPVAANTALPEGFTIGRRLRQLRRRLLMMVRGQGQGQEQEQELGLEKSEDSEDSEGFGGGDGGSVDAGSGGGVDEGVSGGGEGVSDDIRVENSEGEEVAEGTTVEAAVGVGAEARGGSGGGSSGGGSGGGGGGRSLRSLDIVDGSDVMSVGNNFGGGVSMGGGVPGVAPKCKVRWSTGRDNREMSTTPMVRRLYKS